MKNLWVFLPWSGLIVVMGCGWDRVPLYVEQNRIMIPGGTFTMGGMNEGNGIPLNAQPPLIVTISAFELDRTEVTVAQFSAVVGRVNTVNAVCAAYGALSRGNADLGSCMEHAL